jgi:hypothetical protein
VTLSPFDDRQGGRAVEAGEQDACAVQVQQLRAVDTDTGDCGQPPV